MGFVRSPKNALAGLMFIAFAVVVISGINWATIGSASHMGPGYFPLLLAGILLVLGVAIVIMALRVRDLPMPARDWRGLLIISLAIVTFAATIEWLGFVLAVGISTLICTLAGRPFKPVGALVLSAALIVLCTLVFIYGLRLNFHLWP